MVFLPSVGITAGRGGPVLLHELGSFPCELQLFACLAEAELLGEFVENVGRGHQVYAFILLDSVLEGPVLSAW